MIELLLFYLFGATAVFCALIMIVSKKAVTSAISLIAVMFCIAALFALQNAHLLAALQLVVYAGAIMVLFLFVIMLLNLREKGGMLTGRQPLIQIGAVALLATLMTPLVALYKIDQVPNVVQAGDDFGTTAAVGTSLFTDYLLPFEMASVLLLAALVGAVILTKTRR